VTLIPSQRHLFSVPEDVAYFNCAYYSPQLRASEEKLIEGVREKARPWEKTAQSFFTDPETIRGLSSEIFGGDIDGWAITPAASYGLSTAARAIEPTLTAGDRIVVMAEEFPSNVLPWRATAREKGAVIVTVPTPADGDWSKAIVGHIESGVKVVAVAPCHWTTGAFVDLQPIGEACRREGAAFVIDASQALGVMPLDLASLKPDFLAAVAYKWLLGPYGLALLHVSEKWRESRPLEESWFARDNAEDFTALAKYSDGYMKGARRFDMGEKAVPTTLPGAIAALEQIKSWGVANIAETLAAINGRIAAHLTSLGFELPPDRQRSPHMFGAKVPSKLKGAAGLVAELRQRKIFISQRGDAVRFAPHVYVHTADVDRLLTTLTELVG
jgi:selenocysteine lyase/cysteine desulfurase